jgi:hypothetical protein
MHDKLRFHAKVLPKKQSYMIYIYIYIQSSSQLAFLHKLISCHVCVYLYRVSHISKLTSYGVHVSPYKESVMHCISKT